MSQALTTALYENHVQRKAKLTPFGGYTLPVWFSSLKDEHTAVRTSAGCFDISHMGLLDVSGENCHDFLQTLVCNNVDKTKNGKMVYAMMLNENGGILDDIMMGECPKNPGRFLIVVNASNKEKIMSWINSKKPDSVTLKDMNKTRSFIAVQGPKAAEILDFVFNADLSAQPRFSLRHITLNGISASALRTGYTGEDGFELIVPHEHVSKIWDACLSGGITPCGLAARDTLRLEAGLPLYGQELSETITPLMTRYPWVIAWDKDFIGKQALVNQKSQEKDWVTVGIEMQERIIPRSHYPIQEGGEVTSGTLSPTLDKPIAMALVKPQFAEQGSIVHVSIRQTLYPATVVPIPFK